MTMDNGIFLIKVNLRKLLLNLISRNSQRESANYTPKLHPIGAIKGERYKYGFYHVLKSIALPHIFIIPVG